MSNVSQHLSFMAIKSARSAFGGPLPLFLQNAREAIAKNQGRLRKCLDDLVMSLFLCARIISRVKQRSARSTDSGTEFTSIH